MQIIHTISELRASLKNQASIGFVPTMGNLHAGHIGLVEVAKKHAKTVVVSIFVNPLQFGANEDFGNYPRTLEADCEKLKAAGADIVFAPSAQEMYPDADADEKSLNQTMHITPPPIANTLCGASRPGHFSGVATVVMKLFNLVQPQIAVFGQKDFQQLFIIREMVKQFNLPIEIIGVETVREPSGLAMSSRNGYLSSDERAQASQLSLTLRQIAHAIHSGNRDFTRLEAEATHTLTQLGWRVDYIAICNEKNLQAALCDDAKIIVLGAAFLGKTRLIDNLACSTS